MMNDHAFQMSASNVRVGIGCTTEVGMDLQELGIKRALIVMDPRLKDLSPGQTVTDSLRRAAIDFDVFDGVQVEPTDASFQAAIEFASAGRFDGYVAVGGGSTIDTAKAANLYATYPGEFLQYVNAPIGLGQPVPGPLRPLVAIPTTAGTGSEATGVAIFDELSRKAKTGIAHRYLKPTLGIVDANNTATLPSAVAASAGLDVLSHALESFTALPFDQRPLPARPIERPAYQGCNPISDIWAIRALEIVATYLIRAVDDPQDVEARSQMLLAATMAGIGFGNAGVHLPHGMSYPVAGMVRAYRPHGYDVDHPLVPHGTSVIIHTPAVVRFTASACPDRHLRVAEALGQDSRDIDPRQAGEFLAETVIGFIRRLGLPNGLSALGYNNDDLPNLVAGTLPQHRVTKLSPRPVDAEVLKQLFQDSFRLWE